MTAPTPEQLAAARQLERETRAVMDAAYEAHRQAAKAWEEAAEEDLRLSKLALPVSELLIHALADVTTPGGWTLQKLIKRTCHDPADVAATLDEFISRGRVRHYNGRDYAIRLAGGRYTAVEAS